MITVCATVQSSDSRHRSAIKLEEMAAFAGILHEPPFQINQARLKSTRSLIKR